MRWTSAPNRQEKLTPDRVSDFTVSSSYVSFEKQFAACLAEHADQDKHFHLYSVIFLKWYPEIDTDKQTHSCSHTLHTENTLKSSLLILI